MKVLEWWLWEVWWWIAFTGGGRTITRWYRLSYQRHEQFNRPAWKEILKSMRKRMESTQGYQENRWRGVAIFSLLFLLQVHFYHPSNSLHSSTIDVGSFEKFMKTWKIVLRVSSPRKQTIFPSLQFLSFFFFTFCSLALFTMYSAFLEASYISYFLSSKLRHYWSDCMGARVSNSKLTKTLITKFRGYLTITISLPKYSQTLGKKKKIIYFVHSFVNFVTTRIKASFLSYFLRVPSVFSCNHRIFFVKVLLLYEFFCIGIFLFFLFLHCNLQLYGIGPWAIFKIAGKLKRNVEEI